MSEGVDATVPPPLVGGGNLSALLTWAAEAWGPRCALVFDGAEIGYEELERRSGQAATYLAGRGVAPGDRVGLQLGNSPAFVALYYGILRLGAVVVPQNPLATPAEAERNLEDAGARLVVSAPPSLDGLEPYTGIHPVDPDQTAVILYTSGTTGRPKGAELTHANLGRNADAAVDMYGLAAGDVVLGTLPLYHSYGQTCTLNGAIAVGARVVLAEWSDGERVAELIRANAVTVLLGVPTMFADLAYSPVDDAAFASLRMCASGGAPLPMALMEDFERRAPVALLESYGLSETSPIASFNGLGPTRRPGTVGWPIAGTEMRIVGEDGATLGPGEIGEIAIRGHNVMKGYWGNPQATRDAIDDAGWFFSGDLGTVDEDGCFRVVGRLKDMIIRGGLNVYPRELEDLLHQHPAVRSAAVVGVADDRLGEEIGAAIVLEDGADASPAELREWVKARVAPYKYPRHVWIVDELPTGPTGKILKRAISAPTGLGGGERSRS